MSSKSQQINSKVPDYTNYSLEEERQTLQNFLRKNNIWIPEGFCLNLRQGDVIDIYTCPPEMQQIFGNGEFKRLCSYSEEQMKQLPFTKLFWRSDEIQLKVIRKATEVALFGNEAVPWNIEKHELIESLHPQKRTFEVDLGHVCPCFNVQTNQRVAFASSLRVDFIFEWGVA